VVLVDTHVVEAVVAVPARQLVVKAGRIMAVDGAYTS
jgi:hypothetical protein